MVRRGCYSIVNDPLVAQIVFKGWRLVNGPAAGEDIYKITNQVLKMRSKAIVETCPADASLRISSNTR